MAASRKDALSGVRTGNIWRAPDPGQGSCDQPGVMRNATNHWFHLAPHPSPSWDTAPLTASSAAVRDSAHVLRGASGRVGGASPLRGAKIEGPCARVGAATRVRTRSRALPRGMRSAHAVVVCGQGIESAACGSRHGGRQRPRRPCAALRPAPRRRTQRRRRAVGRGFEINLSSCRRSSAASARSHSLNATIFGNFATAFEQTIQYA